MLDSAVAGLVGWDPNGWRHVGWRRGFHLVALPLSTLADVQTASLLERRGFVVETAVARTGLEVFGLVVVVESFPLGYTAQIAAEKDTVEVVGTDDLECTSECCCRLAVLALEAAVADTVLLGHPLHMATGLPHVPVQSGLALGRPALFACSMPLPAAAVASLALANDLLNLT